MNDIVAPTAESSTTANTAAAAQRGQPMAVLQPPGWAAPRGYANGILTEFQAGSRLIFVGGQIGWNGQCEFESDDFAEQTAQALRNVIAVLEQGGARAEHIARMTWYVKDKAEYVAAYPAIGKHYREIIGRHFPAMTAVEVADLIEPRARVEIEVTAVVPPAA
ncbi:RidA family protein [Cupriavidus gilardii]